MTTIPNFTIILPGSCQANCSFCYWKEEKASKNYLSQLSKALKKLPSEYTRCTISGGEPTISPHLQDVVALLRKSRQWEAIVLATNGCKLADFTDLDVDHVNISRHHFNDNVNSFTFKTKNLPTTEELVKIIDAFNANGKDITLNAVLSGILSTEDDFKQYIQYAKKVGASGVVFRADQRRQSTDLPEESKLLSYKLVAGWSCPACKVWKQVVSGMPVSWKAAVAEPSKTIGDVYELVFHPNGKLTSDWAGQDIFVPKTVLTAKLSIPSSKYNYGCGSVRWCGVSEASCGSGGCK